MVQATKVENACQGGVDEYSVKVATFVSEHHHRDCCLNPRGPTSPVRIQPPTAVDNLIDFDHVTHQGQANVLQEPPFLFHAQMHPTSQFILRDGGREGGNELVWPAG